MGISRRFRADDLYVGVLREAQQCNLDLGLWFSVYGNDERLCRMSVQGPQEFLGNDWTVASVDVEHDTDDLNNSATHTTPTDKDSLLSIVHEDLYGNSDVPAFLSTMRAFNAYTSLERGTVLSSDKGMLKIALCNNAGQQIHKNVKFTMVDTACSGGVLKRTLCLFDGEDETVKLGHMESNVEVWKQHNTSRSSVNEGILVTPSDKDWWCGGDIYNNCFTGKPTLSAKLIRDIDSAGTASGDPKLELTLLTTDMNKVKVDLPSGLMSLYHDGLFDLDKAQVAVSAEYLTDTLTQDKGTHGNINITVTDPLGREYAFACRYDSYVLGTLCVVNDEDMKSEEALKDRDKSGSTLWKRRTRIEEDAAGVPRYVSAPPGYKGDDAKMKIYNVSYLTCVNITTPDSHQYSYYSPAPNGRNIGGDIGNTGIRKITDNICDEEIIGPGDIGARLSVREVGGRYYLYLNVDVMMQGKAVSHSTCIGRAQGAQIGGSCCPYNVGGGNKYKQDDASYLDNFYIANVCVENIPSIKYRDLLNGATIMGFVRDFLASSVRRLVGAYLFSEEDTKDDKPGNEGVIDRWIKEHVLADYRPTIFPDRMHTYSKHNAIIKVALGRAGDNMRYNVVLDYASVLMPTLYARPQEKNNEALDFLTKTNRKVKVEDDFLHSLLPALDFMSEEERMYSETTVPGDFLYNIGGVFAHNNPIPAGVTHTPRTVMTNPHKGGVVETIRAPQAPSERKVSVAEGVRHWCSWIAALLCIDVWGNIYRSITSTFPSVGNAFNALGSGLYSVMQFSFSCLGGVLSPLVSVGRCFSPSVLQNGIGCLFGCMKSCWQNICVFSSRLVWGEKALKVMEDATGITMQDRSINDLCVQVGLVDKGNGIDPLVLTDVDVSPILNDKCADMCRG